MKVQKFKRGQIWWYNDGTNYDGHIQGGRRPVIIISNDIANELENVLIGIPCTTTEKSHLPCNLKFTMNGNINTALGTNIRSLNPDKLTGYIGICDDELMEKINECIKISLGLVDIPKENIKNSVELNNEVRPLTSEELFNLRYFSKNANTTSENITPVFEDNNPLEEKLSTKKAYEGVGKKGHQKYTKEQMIRFINDCENHTIEWVTKKYNCTSEKATSNKLYRFRKFLKENP